LSIFASVMKYVFSKFQILTAEFIQQK